MLTQTTSSLKSFDTFISSLKQAIHSSFYERDDIEKFTQKRGFPALVLRDIMAQNPFSAAIPEKYGGRGGKVKECLSVMEAASYESLPLSLTFGINMALFLEPVVKYAEEDVKAGIFNRFLTQQNMGGLMITEPDYGSDALSMQTSNKKAGTNYHIEGTKHWQGLTGMADYWLMTSRNKNESGELGRDIDFFICDVQQPNQHIVVDEYYNNMGLYPIPYGKNLIDIQVPEQYKLKPESTGLKLMMDLLHRSRYHFPGMGMGFIKRMLDESIKHCSERIVGGVALITLDQVQHQISRIQSAFTICSAMCARSAGYSGVDRNLATDGIEANSLKAYVTDLMQESAQTLTQLSGANGYKAESLGTRSIVDSRPFQIFEGSNDMLYSQISDMALKMMIRKKTDNLLVFLNGYNLTSTVSEQFKKLLNFSVDSRISQRKRVDLGKIIARVVSANHVLTLGASGFRPDLIAASIETIKHEVSMFVSSYKFESKVATIADYNEGSSWLNFSS